MTKTELETLSDMLGDFIHLWGESLSGSDRNTLSDARFIIERAVEEVAA